MCSQNICRLCLKSPSKTVDIFSSDIPFLIEALTYIKVEKDDGLPTLSCEDCVSDLHVAYEVRNRIIESDKKLRNNTDCSSDDDPTEITIKEEFDAKISLENISDASQRTQDDVLANNSDYDDVEDGSSGDGDDAIDSLIRSIKDDEDSCEDIEGKSAQTESVDLEENEEIKKEAGENSDFSVGKDARDEEEGIVSSTGSNTNEQIEDVSKDYVIIPEADNIIRVETSGRKRKYSCLLCNTELEQRNVYLHKGKHIKAKCNICGLITRAHNVRKHLLTHKIEPQICDICGSSHRSAEGLRSHVYYFHTNRTPYKCKHCDEQFRVSTHLQEHIRRFHTGARPYQCDACGKAFMTAFILKRHKEQVHQGLRLFPCESCQKAFSSRNALVTHRRQHTGELPYKCELCAEGFRQLVSLRTHMKSKHKVIVKPNKPGYRYSNQRKNELKKQLEDKITERRES